MSHLTEYFVTVGVSHSRSKTWDANIGRIAPQKCILVCENFRIDRDPTCIKPWVLRFFKCQIDGRLMHNPSGVGHWHGNAGINIAVALPNMNAFVSVER